MEDFVYLGAWVGSTEHDFIVRKAKAWAACHKMKKIWKSKLRKDLKIRLFEATVSLWNPFFFMVQRPGLLQRPWRRRLMDAEDGS